MFEKVTDRVRKALDFANHEARQFQHPYLGTEHLLLGLVEEGSGVAAQLLTQLNLDAATIRREIQKLVLPGSEPVGESRLPLTPRAKNAFALANEESRRLGQSFIGTEHLLLGLMAEQEGLASVILRNAGLSLNNLRNLVCSAVGLPSDDDGAESEPTPDLESDDIRNAMEFDVYLPLRYADGKLIEPEKVTRAKQQLAEHFGGFTYYLHRFEVCQKILDVTFNGEILILHVLTENCEEGRVFLRRFKDALKADLRQAEILIVGRSVQLL